VIGCHPSVDDLGDLDLVLSDPESSRRLLAPIAGVALHIHDQKCGHFA
jgi:hypothetical protein